ncbi:MAG: VOC family protein, partial [bacterium]
AGLRGRELDRPREGGRPTRGARYQLTLPVDNVDDLCKKLGEAGVTLLNGPMDRPWGIRTAAFQDPSGHIWEVAHKL